MESSEGICVAIRIRPLNEREKNSSEKAFRCISSNAISQFSENQPNEGQTYYYDKVLYYIDY